jgi:hypothetical protein
MIGKTIDIVVTSVLQTTAGKMIFGRFLDPALAAQTAPAAATVGAAAEGDRRRHVPPNAAAAGK